MPFKTTASATLTLPPVPATYVAFAAAATTASTAATAAMAAAAATLPLSSPACMLTVATTMRYSRQERWVHA